MEKNDNMKAFDINDSKSKKKTKKEDTESCSNTSSKNETDGLAFKVNENTSGTDK